MTTIGSWLSDAARDLTKAGVGSAALDAELILSHVLRHDRAWLKAHHEHQLTPAQVAITKATLTRRTNREPLVHLTGKREFYGMDFIITPDVLTPRVETEQMVEWAIKYAPKDSRLIDVGTGCGAIAIAIAKHRPDLQITATDVTDEALSVARDNAQVHGVKVSFIISDLWRAIPAMFDTIVTNLPYLTDGADLMPEVRREPAVALFGGPDGLSLYRKFLEGIPEHLAPGGHLFTECDPWQQPALLAEAAKYGLGLIEQGYFILGFTAAR